MKLAKHVVSTNLMDERLAFSCSWSKSQTPKTRLPKGKKGEGDVALDPIDYNFLHVEAPHLPRLRLPSCENSFDHETEKNPQDRKTFQLTGAEPACAALMWTIKFLALENALYYNVLYHTTLNCKFPLIQVNESALSCFSDLRRQIFRPGLISNVISNVISNCLSQSGLELNLSF